MCISKECSFYSSFCENGTDYISLLIFSMALLNVFYLRCQLASCQLGFIVKCKLINWFLWDIFDGMVLIRKLEVDHFPLAFRDICSSMQRQGRWTDSLHGGRWWPLLFPEHRDVWFGHLQGSSSFILQEQLLHQKQSTILCVPAPGVKSCSNNSLLAFHLLDWYIDYIIWFLKLRQKLSALTSKRIYFLMKEIFNIFYYFNSQ